MNEIVQDLEQGLKKQKYDLSKNTGIAKLIKSYREAKEELDALTESGEVNVKDTGKIIKAGEKVSSLFKQINRSFREIQGGDNQVLKTLFPENFSAKIDKGIREIDRYFKKLKEKGSKETQVTNFTQDLDRLNNQLGSLQNRRIKAEVEVDISEATKKLEQLEKKREELRASFAKRLVPEEQKDDKGRTKTEQLQANVASKEKSYEKAEAKVKNLKRRELTKKEKTDINDLRESYEGSDFKRREGAAKATYKKYLDEARSRDVAKETNTTDSGRDRRKLGRISDQELNQKIQDAEKEIKALEEERESYKKRIEEIEARPDTEYKENQKKAKTAQKAAKTKLDNARKELEDYSELQRNQREIAEQKANTFISGGQVSEATEEEIKQLKEYGDQVKETTDKLKELKQEKTFSSKEEKEEKVGAKASEIKAKELSIQKIKDSIAEIDKNTTIEGLFAKLEELNIPTGDIEKTEEGIRNLRGELSSLDSKAAESIRQELMKMGVSAEDTEEAIKLLTKGLDKIDLETEDIKKSTQEIENLKNQVISFFSIGNTIELFKRSVQSAFNTVKELDAVMTETATVTDFTVGDMWDKLPQYADEASKLGASIKDVYSATTLYYQQGLKTNEAMAVGVETMKMARIANMDAADATQAMTAALRGFNMEISETSAQHVNDVYSELAAITAADTSQIAAAMSKTASIASSANMEFETTAALLSQIIETTQEAPETAGTAMKTIIARFTEVKELFGKGMLTGEDEEGEAIDINKIDTALKTVGISLKDFLNGSKGIDDIFLELASKWDTLDLATQRYIATTAAGSRQQSRFIAMMSNYDRTMELVTAANNSAGASQKQYEKTLESMDAKLQQLKNAWDEFVMGLANNEVIKFGVDLLTGILTVVNKLTSALSGDNGLVKSFISLVTVVGALKGGGAIVKGIGNKFLQFLTSEPSKNNKKNAAHEEEVREETQQSKAEEVVKKTVEEATEEVTQVTPKDLQKAEYNGEQIGLAIGKGVKEGVEDSGAKEAIDKLTLGTSGQPVELESTQKYVNDSGDAATGESQKEIINRKLDEMWALKADNENLSYDNQSLLHQQSIHPEDQAEQKLIEAKLAAVREKQYQNQQRINELQAEIEELQAQVVENPSSISESEESPSSISESEEKTGSQKKTRSQRKEERRERRKKKKEEKKQKKENIKNEREEKKKKKGKEENTSSKKAVEDLNALNDSQQKVTQATTQSTKATEDFAQKTRNAGAEADKTGNSVAGSGEKLKENADAAKNSARNWVVFSGACMAAGSALNMLGQLGEKQDWPEFLTDALQGAGTALSGFGGIASSLMMMFPQLAAKIQISAKGIAIAGTTAQAGWLPFIAVITLIIAIIGLVVAGFQAMNKNSPEEKLKAATEAANKASEAADSAAESYNNLAESLDKLEGKYKALESLAYGTQAWREQIQEINDSVLELIDTYPELINAVTIGKGGVLELDPEQTQQVLEKERKNKIKLQNASIEAKRSEAGAQINFEYSKLDSKVQQGSYTSQEGANILAKALAGEGENGLELLKFINNPEYGDKSKAIQKWLAKYNEDMDNDNKLNWDGSEEDIQELINYGQELLTYEKTAESTYGVTASNAIALSGLGGKAAESATNFLASGRMQELATEKKKSLQDLSIDEDRREEWKAKKAEYAEIYGYKYDADADSFKDSEGEEVEVTDSQITTQLGMIEATEAASEAVKKFAGGLNSINKSDTLKKFVEGADGKNFTKDDLKKMVPDGTDLSSIEVGDFKDQVAKYAENEYQMLQQAYGSENAKLLFGTLGKFVADYQEATGNALVTFKQVDKKLAEFSFSTTSANGQTQSKDLSDIGIDSASLWIKQAISENLQRVSSLTGTEDVLLQEIDKIASTLNPEEQKILWEALGTIDWSSIDSVENLDQIVKDLGITSPELIQRFQELEGVVIKAAKATKEWTGEILDGEVKPIEDLINDLEGREPGDRTFNREQKEQILKASPELKDLFVKTGVDEFTFIGEDMDQLTNALQELRQTILDQASKDIEQRAETSQKWQEAMSGEVSVAEKKGNVGEEASKVSMEQVVTDLLAKGVTGEGTTSEFSLNQVFRALGLQRTGDTQKDLEFLREQYDTYYGVGGGVAEQNIAAAGELGTEVNQQKYSGITSTTDLYGIQPTTPEEAKALEAALDGLILKEEGLSAAVEKTAIELANGGKVTDEHRKKAKKLVIDTNNSRKAIKNLCETVEDNNEAFKKNDGSTAYMTALENITQAAQETFGKKGIDSKFVEYHRLQFQQLAEGGEVGAAAYKEIQKAASEAAATALSKNQDLGMSLEEINTLKDQISDDFTMHGYADVTDIINKLIQAGMTAEEAIGWVEQLTGSTISFDVEYENRVLPHEMAKSLGLEKAHDFPSSTHGMYKVPKFIARGNNYRGSGYSPGGGGGGGGDSDKWENPYDRLHNVLKDIDNELKKRDRLERNYQRVLESLDVSANELIKISQEEIASLNRQKQRELERQNTRSSQIENYYNSEANAKYRDYVYYERDENGYYTIKIDYDKMAQVEDADLGAGIEEFYDKMSEWAEDYNESKDSVEEIEDSVKEIEERGKDQYLSFEDAVKEALVESYQKEIDELQAINDSINDTNASLVNAIQDSITKQRQERENQKTEEDLEKKQRRLLYLQQDTSGANDLEILQLQREIEEGQQDYTDTLIDQKISELQEQNDKAAEQRERQISLLESQLEWYQLSGEIWKEVDELIKEGVDPDKGLKSDSRLAQILKLTDSYSGLSEVGKQEWWKEYNSMIAEALAWLMKDSRQLENLSHMKSGDRIKFITADGKEISGTVQDNGDVKADDGSIYTGVYAAEKNDENRRVYRTTELAKKTKDQGVKGQSNSSNNNNSQQQYNKTKFNGRIVSEIQDIIWTGSPISNRVEDTKAVQQALKSFNTKEFDPGAVDGLYGQGTAKAMMNLQNYVGLEDTGSLDNQTKKYLARYHQYKTGGLADFTGPAWLDGTKARPELVLNARDTENFIQLKDILSSILNGASKASTENNGDISYDIDINVESIGSDYDVEQIANKVKTMIGEDARYRNNNMVNVSR